MCRALLGSTCAVQLHSCSCPDIVVYLSVCTGAPLPLHDALPLNIGHRLVWFGSAFCEPCFTLAPVPQIGFGLVCRRSSRDGR